MEFCWTQGESEHIFITLIVGLCKARPPMLKCFIDTRPDRIFPDAKLFNLQVSSIPR
jgi:hypothetical protein